MTIVILIILATVSINMLISGGLLEETQNSKQIYELSEEKQKLELVKATALINGLGELTIDNYIDELIKEGITTEADVTDNGDGSKTIITDNGYKATITPTPDNKDLIIEVEEKVRDAVDSGEDEQPEEPDVPEVQIPLVTSISMNKTEIDLAVGGTTTISTTILPADASKTLLWETSNESVVRVNNGTLEAVGIGTATITATAQDGSGINSTCTITILEKLSDVMLQPASTSNKAALDDYGNKIIIPAGFTVVPHGTTSVAYSYTGNSNSPAIQDGVVIKDSEGNQFVWIPVGEINNKDGSTTNIVLGRYDDFEMESNTDLPTPAQVASRTAYDYPPVDIVHDEYGYGYVEISSNFASGSHRLESGGSATYYFSASSFDNEKAKDLQAFISKTLDNGGYYIARYEASYGTDGKPNSIEASGNSQNSAPTTNGILWNYIKQVDAAAASRRMYSNANFESDLINSYAWDTAIIFIQAYSGNNAYSKQESLIKWYTHSLTIVNTGERPDTDTTDKVCNIYDLASNASEWCTEAYYRPRNYFY